MRISFMSPVLVVLGVSVLVAQGPAPSRTPYGRIAVTSQNVLALREWDTNVDSRLRSGELVRRKVRRDTMLSGRQHERYDQYWSGLRVAGGDVVRQIRNGSTQSNVWCSRHRAVHSATVLWPSWRP